MLWYARCLWSLALKASLSLSQLSFIWSRSSSSSGQEVAWLAKSGGAYFWRRQKDNNFRHIFLSFFFRTLLCFCTANMFWLKNGLSAIQIPGKSFRLPILLFVIKQEILFLTSFENKVNADFMIHYDFKSKVHNHKNDIRSTQWQWCE